jgi:hypothetical protein
VEEPDDFGGQRRSLRKRNRKRKRKNDEKERDRGPRALNVLMHGSRVRVRKQGIFSRRGGLRLSVDAI